MKAKKLLSLLTATTLVFSTIITPMTAFAADQSDLTGVTATTDATVDYINAASVIKITVPTSAALAFTLDPQNLAQTLGVGTWNPTGGGTIIPQAVATVVNKSAVPVKTAVNFTVTDTATTKATLVSSTDAATINDGTDKKMFLTVTPANAKTAIDAAEIAATTSPVFFQSGGSAAVYTVSALTGSGVSASLLKANTAAATAAFADYVCVDDSATSKTYNQVEVPVHSLVASVSGTSVLTYNATTGGLGATTAAATVSSTGANLAFVMNAAAYYVKNTSGTYSLVYKDQDTNTNYDTASFIIGGTLNKNADWSGYASGSKITLSAAYTFTAMSVADATTALTSKVATTYNSVATVTPVTPVAPTFFGSTTTLNVTKGSSSIVLPFNLGAGTSAVSVTGVSFVLSGTTYSALGQTVAADGTITLSNSNGSIAYVLTTLGTYVFTVTTTGGVTHTISVVVKA